VESLHPAEGKFHLSLSRVEKFENSIINLLVLVGAELVSFQLRVRLPWGNPLSTDYDGLSLWFWLSLLVAILLSQGVITFSEKVLTQKGVNSTRWLPQTMLSLLIALALIGVLLPSVSKLQMLYFGISSIVTMAIIYVARAGALPSYKGLIYHLRRLFSHRDLLTLWLQLNIQARYTQTILGVIWIILLPLATSLVLSFAFAEVLNVKLDVPFVSFFLSAIVAWNLFNQGTLNMMRSILASLGLINQVSFPREILVLLAMGEALIDFVFTFCAMLIVNAFNGIWPNANYLYLPLIIAILLCFTTGLGFIISFLSVQIRDIPQLISVVLQLLFYLTPIIFPATRIPAQFRIFTLLNPLTSIIQSFRDIVVYNHPPDVVSLYYPLVIGILLLYTGYTFFKTHENRLADLL
jgi:lipopolysaccharide transport system permease protein